MTGLYFQPAPGRSNDNSLPTAPDQGQDVSALIDQLTNRINSSERRIEHMVDRRSLAKIILTDRDLVLMGDQVSIVGQLNIVDWIRDMSGNPTGGIDPASMTRITGGKIQTGVIESFNWSVMTGSQFDLDNGTIVTGGSVSPKFSVSSSGQLTCVDAIVTGQLQAGSIIAGSVTINDALGPTLDEIASGVDIQGALTAGVTNILAGVGTDFRLNVDTVNSLITLQHKDAVFLGTASAGSNKPGLGISSSGIGIGYNRASDGTWITSITLDASGNAAFLGTVTAGSIISNTVTVSGVTLGTILSMATDGFDINDLLLNGGTAILEGVLVPTNTGAIKTGTITWNSTTGALTGGTGIAITEWGIIGAASGSVTFTLQASTGAATFKGDITGGSNINISGNAIFQGNSTLGGADACVHVNQSLAATNGIMAYCDSGTGTAALKGIATTTNTTGVIGQSNVVGAVALRGVNSFSGGIGLAVTGAMTISSNTLVSNLNADMVDGIHASALCQIVPCNTGTCTVSGNGFNLNVTGSLAATVRTRGTTNFAYIENISDERLKQNICDESLGLDFILSLKPRSFRMRADPTRLCHGFIAQEVNSVTEYDDNLASQNSDGTWGFDYNGISSPIVKSIQELYAKYELQNDLINDLLNALEMRDGKRFKH